MIIKIVFVDMCICIANKYVLLQIFFAYFL